MNEQLNLLHPYPFQKLSALFSDLTPPKGLAHIALSIGEPKHTPPAFVLETLKNELAKLANYPLTKGLLPLRQAIADWLIWRFDLPGCFMDAEKHVLPVNGTREALFAIAQAVVNVPENAPKPKVFMPNPFYQIYEGAAFLAGAEPVYLNCTAENDFLPDLDAISEADWHACQLFYFCTPGNPTGKTADLAYFEKLIGLAMRYNFVLCSDECYSELYPVEGQAPIGLLQACAELGHLDYQNCLVFHSLSKRSNLPGLRSGFVAGDAQILEKFLTYRTYHGCAMPVPSQLASIAAWKNEAHVLENRQLYRTKFEQVIEILSPVIPVTSPEAGFYLWLKTPISDTDFARGLFAQQHVTVLPGSYLSREAQGLNPGEHYVRMALVATVDECVEAAWRIRRYIESL